MDRIMEDFWTNRGHLFSMDIVSNLIWYSVGRELPQNPYELHALRELFRQYTYAKPSLVSMLDFAENFGTNTRNIYSQLRAIEDLKARADQDYLEGEFASSNDRMKSLLDELGELEIEAIRLKNSALAWVFLIEWLSVSATMLTCGAVLWQLMVKRGAYRDVSMTRLSPQDDS
jgi:hypothetical protein